MHKYVVLLGALSFAAPITAFADDNQPPRSFTDLTANDPPAATFRAPSLPPGLGGTFPPGCAVLLKDKDDKHGHGLGDDNNGSTGNPNCQNPASAR